MRDRLDRQTSVVAPHDEVRARPPRDRAGVAEARGSAGSRRARSQVPSRSGSIARDSGRVEPSRGGPHTAEGASSARRDRGRRRQSWRSQATGDERRRPPRRPQSRRTGGGELAQSRAKGGAQAGQARAERHRPGHARHTAGEDAADVRERRPTTEQDWSSSRRASARGRGNVQASSSTRLPRHPQG